MLTALRWCNESPPSGKSGGGVSTPSFKEVLLAAIHSAAMPAPAEAPSPPPSVHVGGASPRIVVLPRDARRPKPLPGPDKDGWQTAVSRRTRKHLRRLDRRHRRTVPVDLRGRCFNCFSSKHRAASCRSVTRCFRCRALGHRAHDCSACRLVSPSTNVPWLVWRPTQTATMPSPTAAAPPPPGDDGSGRRR